MAGSHVNNTNDEKIGNPIYGHWSKIPSIFALMMTILAKLYTHTHRHTETSKSQISIHAIVSGLSTMKGDRFDFLRCCCSIVVPYYHYHHHLVIVVELCNMKNWYKIYINGWKIYWIINNNNKELWEKIR